MDVITFLKDNQNSYSNLLNNYFYLDIKSAYEQHLELFMEANININPVLNLVSGPKFVLKK